jgi:hypothetical protein
MDKHSSPNAWVPKDITANIVLIKQNAKGDEEKKFAADKQIEFDFEENGTGTILLKQDYTKLFY